MLCSMVSSCVVRASDPGTSIGTRVRLSRQYSAWTRQRQVNMFHPHEVMSCCRRFTFQPQHRWLAVFFVPTLVILPLSPAPSAQNALRLLAIVFGGWFLSLATTAAVVTALSPGTPAVDSPAPGTPSKAPAVFKKRKIQTLGIGAALAGVTSILTFGSMRTVLGFSLGKLALPTRQISLLFATLFGFSAGTRMPKSLRKAVHPVVTCTTVAITTAALIGRGCAVSFADMLRSYVTKSR